MTPADLMRVLGYELFMQTGSDFLQRHDIAKNLAHQKKVFEAKSAGMGKGKIHNLDVREISPKNNNQEVTQDPIQNGVQIAAASENDDLCEGTKA